MRRISSVARCRPGSMRRSRQRGSGESGLSRLHPRSSVVAWRAREGSGYDERGHAAAVMQSGGGAAVLAQQSAQPGCHQDLSFTIAERGIAGRGPKRESAVGPSPVVVLDVLLQDASEVAFVQDKK